MFRRSSFKDASDEALMAALQKGRQQALAELYLRYNEKLRYYFFRMTGRDAERARDLCQDLFVKVADHVHRFRSTGVFRTWLYSMAHNMCKNHYRHQQVVDAALRDLRWDAQAPPDPNLLAQLDESAFRECLDRTLAQLDADRRGAFLLRHREGLSLREIAAIQDCPLGTVKSRLHYAHRFLARQLAGLQSEIFTES